MPTLLITGANRGLGLEFVKQYLADGWKVLACCRKPADAGALQEVASGSDGRVTIHELDVADFGRIDALAKELAGESIDLLLNNAGVFGDRNSFGGVEYKVWERTFRINTMAPHKMAEAFIEHVAKSERKQIAHVTSKMGSIADNGSGGSYVYRSSKSALNMVTKSQALDLRSRGVTCVVLHPGWVATDMGGAGAPVQPPESVAGMKSVLDGLTLEQSGKFFEFSGAEVPW